MVRLAVISDSHWSRTRVEMFANLAKKENFDAILHLGDGVSDAKWLAKNLSVPVRYVSGNCDPKWSCERELRLSYEHVRLLCVHGDLYNVKYDPSGLSYHAEEIGAQVVLFGHTHRAYAGFVGRVMMVNPGSLRDGKYAVLEIDGSRANPYLKDF